MNMNDLKWTREPADYSVNGGRITVTTAPHTDLWQRTYYAGLLYTADHSKQ